MNRDLYIKENVNEHEYEMHRHVYKLNVVKTPKIIAYDRESKVMIMERIPLMNVSDYYGEEEEKVPSAIFAQVRDIVKTLYKNNIIYPDITGYNFLLSTLTYTLYSCSFTLVKHKFNLKFLSTNIVKFKMAVFWL